MYFHIVFIAAFAPMSIVDSASLRQTSSHYAQKPATLKDESGIGLVSRSSLRQTGSNATQPARHNSSEGNASATRHEVSTMPATQRPPRVYFLFMAVDKVANWAVWRSFFAAAPPDQYRALIHCKGLACKVFASTSKPLKLVPTVASSYCHDLVSPMNQLLDSALQDDPWSTNERDKFVFVSDSTLPAKPFWHIYNTLTRRKGSDFCVFPSKDWADVPGKVYKKRALRNTHELAIKTHQWSVLSRSHTVRAVRLWKEHVMNGLLATFKFNPRGDLWQAPQNRSFGDSMNFGCLDEFWHMYVLFGPWSIVDTRESKEFHYTEFTNSPLRINAEAGWQGKCDTFAMWSAYTSMSLETPQGSKHAASPWVKLYSALDQASIPHTSPDTRPAWWDTISFQGIKAIGQSDFLFVRKFVDHPQLTYGGEFASEYSRVVLSSAIT